MSLHGTIVRPVGPANSRWAIIGERPGESEAIRGEPFVGRAGKEQDRYLGQHGFHSRQFYRANVCWDYADGNPDPTPADIARWAPQLEADLRRRNPSHIIAAGAHAIRWFLGPDTDLDFVHGIPHRSSRVPGAIILPTYHPASGFYDDDARVYLAYDYGRACAAIRGKIDTTPPIDEFEGREEYFDVTGAELEAVVNRQLESDPAAPMSLDTEGIPSLPWSYQVSFAPGTGFVLRCTQADFSRGIAAIRKYVYNRANPVIVIQNAMYDYEMSAVMGLDLFDCNLFDTRYAAYIMRVEPQGLKPLSYRWCGMRQASYEDTVGPAGLEKQIAYLISIIEQDWPKPEPRLEHENDGTSCVYTPQPVERRAEAILKDYYGEKLDKDGNRTDPFKRWRKVDRDLRRMVESRLGRMPIGTLDDIPLDRAIYYSARDPDATLRLYHRLVPALRDGNLTQLMVDGCAVIPVFEQMQRNGMPFDVDYCRKMSGVMWDKMCKLQSYISHRFYEDQPFNPASPDKVAALMRRRGLVGEKRSKITKKVSTGKKSIEHLRYSDDAMANVIDWREHQKMKDSFYDPITERLEDNPGQPIRTHINPYKVVSRRISSSDPNLTAIPVRNELGQQVRDGAIAPDGYVFASFDLSQVEMRYMAHLSQDPLLLQFFREKRDIHRETASRIFRIPLDKVEEKAHRYPAKRAAFGIITSITGHGLLDQLRMAGCEGWDERMCDDLIDDWLGIYKGVQRFMDRSSDEAERTGMVRDEWGMIRYLPGVWSDDIKVKSEARRAASSMKIQGGAQGMLQNSIRWLKPYIRGLQEAGADIRWVLQIHDEVIFILPEEHKEMLEALVREALTQHHGVRNISVPIECSGGFAKSWGKLK